MGRKCGSCFGIPVLNFWSVQIHQETAITMSTISSCSLWAVTPTSYYLEQFQCTWKKITIAQSPVLIQVLKNTKLINTWKCISMSWIGVHSGKIDWILSGGGADINKHRGQVDFHTTLHYIVHYSITEQVKVKMYTVSPQKTCDYIFYNNFNNRCPITVIFGIVSIYLSKKSRLWRRRCRSTTRAPNNVS